MVKLLRIVKGTNGKKWKAVFERSNGRTVTTQFGQAGASDYTKHKDKKRRARYVQRHMKDLKSNDPTRAGYLSMFILWGKSTSRQANINWFKSQLKKKDHIRIFKSAAKQMLKGGSGDLMQHLLEYEHLTGGKDIEGRRFINALELTGGKSVPTDMKTYNKVKARAKKKFKVWPSAYASGWLVKEYKRVMKKKGKKPYHGKKTTGGIARWFKEKWINVCKLPKKVPCGRPKTGMREWKKNYPYCRPSRRVGKGTPKIASSLSKAEIKRRCSRKRKNPMKKVR